MFGKKGHKNKFELFYQKSSKIDNFGSEEKKVVKIRILIKLIGCAIFIRPLRISGGPLTVLTRLVQGLPGI